MFDWKLSIFELHFMFIVINLFNNLFFISEGWIDNFFK